MRGADLDYVVFFKALHQVRADPPDRDRHRARSSTVFRKAMTTWMLDKLWIKSRIRDKLGISSDRILFVEHHQSHAASAFYCSPFDDARY